MYMYTHMDSKDASVALIANKTKSQKRVLQPDKPQQQMNVKYENKKAMHLMRITTLHFCNIASNTRDTFCPSPRMCCTRDSKNTIAMLLNTIVSKIYKPMICSGLKLVFCKQIDFLVYVFD